MPLDYLSALREKAESLDSLSALVTEVERKAAESGVDVQIHSKGTWSRLINGKQEPAYQHLVEIALLCNLPLPPLPPLIAAQGVVEWHRRGKGPPQFGILLETAGTVTIKPDAKATSLAVRLVRPRTGTLRRGRAKSRDLIRLEDIKPVEARLLGRGKSGNPVTLRAAAAHAAAELETPNVILSSLCVDSGSSSGAGLPCLRESSGLLRRD